MFGGQKGIPVMAAGRLQKWVVHLSEFNYELKYIKGSTNFADMCSRIPIRNVQSGVQSEGSNNFIFIEESLPIRFEIIKKKTT